ncbi:MAG: DUF928 domain-containing protein [Coleofasciculus sp. C1-SOL-03]|jgi:hypothetical protein|uniref:DUF928 domain-containing protein n=1 Tax=Coleofasciculus sp. C1-SOL-03 TaxID=3069522 RepID=UPI0033027286
MTFPNLPLILSLILITSTPTNQTQPTTNNPPKPPDSEPAEERNPGGTRGSCEKTDQPFTPLLPLTNNEFSGYTLSGYPTLWFYIPYQTSSLHSGKFTLEDEQQNTIYRQEFSLPQTPGLIKISLPQTAPPLAPNQRYTWKLMLYCTSSGSSMRDRVWHQGWVKRLDNQDLETQVQQAALSQQIDLLIKHNLWYDLPQDISQLRTLPSTWETLLKSMGLADLPRDAIAGEVEAIND